MKYYDVEEAIKAEYNWLQRNIALYPYFSVALALVLGWTVGHFL